MAQIPDLNLPSNPEVIVRLREATVSDAIDFADVAEGMEEAVTSLFLDRLQDKATWTDPKKWTGEDRRMALYWYWLHTSDDLKPALTYTCGVCGEEHTAICEMVRLAEKYTPIQGKPERDIEHGGQKAIVRPLNGEALEEIELLRMELVEAAQKHGPGAGATKVLESRLRLMRFMLCLEFEGDSTRDEREKRVLSMSQSEFASWAIKTESALQEMKHGLESMVEDGRLYLLTYPMPCLKDPEGKEVGTRLRIPFRNIDYIPRV
jgi:hypothetical protein